MPNNCSFAYHIGDDMTVRGDILRGNNDPCMVLSIGTVGDPRVDLFVRDPAFLDRLANEAERLCREFVGDAAPLEPLHMTGQYCQCVECAGGRMSAGPA